MRATIHNAKACTIDGSDCWIATLVDERGRFSCHMEDVNEGPSLAEARAWAESELRRRGFEPKVEVQS